MKVSVVVPCYNVPAHWLRECVSSVVAQSYTDWELILDDCSEVPVESELVGVIPASLAWRILRYTENRGLAAARNNAIRVATGELILPLDADDILDPDFLHEACGRFAANPRLDCVFTDFRLFGEESGIWENRVKPYRAIIDAQWIPGPGTLFRRSLWEKVGGYCEDAVFRIGNEDWDFWISAFEFEPNIEHIPKDLYRYRRTANSLSQKSVKSGYHTTVELMHSRHKEFLKGDGRRFLFNGYLRSIAWGKGSLSFNLILKGIRSASSLRELARMLKAQALRLLSGKG